RSALRELAEVYLDLQNAPRQRRADRSAFNFNVELLDLGLRRRESPLVDRDVEATVGQFHDADRAALGHALADFEQILDLRQPCLRFLHPGVRDQKLCLQIAIIDLEKSVPGIDAITPFHINCRDDSRDGPPNSEVLGTGFHNARAGHIRRKWRGRGVHNRRSSGRRPITNHDCNDRQDQAGRGKQRKQSSTSHRSNPVCSPLVTSIIFPSSMWAMRSANWNMRGSWVTTTSARSRAFPTPRGTSITLIPVS